VKWAEIEVRCSPNSVDAVSELFTAAGCGGTAIRDDCGFPISESGLEDATAVNPQSKIKNSTSHVLGYLPVDDRLEGSLATLRERLRELPGFGLPVEDGLTLRTVQDQDWESAWKEFFKPLRVGRRLVVKPSWEEYDPRPDDLVVELDPGMAFGTGAHPTTQLCLEALEELVQPGARILDFGTGSGILSIAAARLGAAAVTGLDNDPVAAAAADLNVTANRLRNRIRIQGGDLESLAPGDTFEGIVANILAGVILDYAEGLARHCRPGGWLITSGIVDHRAGVVAEGLRDRGFVGLETRHRGEWVAVIGRRGTGA
jgi:ribosomal protein L11 methyltransferase